MKAVLSRLDPHAQRLPIGIGWISLGIGLALTRAPVGTAKFLGWERRERSARLVGAADLIIGTGLLMSPRRSRWMLARATLNAVIGAIYARALADSTPRRKRAVGGVCLMIGLTANDYLLSRRLRTAEASYNLTDI